MSYRLTKAAIHSAAKGTAQHVLATMADAVYDKKVNDNDKKNLRATCNTSKSYLATTAGYSVNTISRALKELQTLGLIAYDPKRKVASSYDLIIPIPKVDQNGQRDGNMVDQNGEPSSKEVPQNGEPSESEVDQNGGEVDQNGQHNRVLKKEEKRESSKQASIVDSGVEGGTGGTNTPKESQAKEEPATSQAKHSCFARLDDKQSFSLNDLKDEMLVELKGKGLPAHVADAKVQAVWPEFKARANELKSKGKLPADNKRRRGYLYKILSDKVNKGPNQVQAQAEEPKSLEEIFKLLLEETKNKNPEIAEHLAQLSVKDLPIGTLNKLSKKEEESWSTVKGSRINYVRSTIEGWMYERIVQARHDEEEELYSCLSHNRNSLAQLKTMPDGYYHPTISYDEAVKNTEARIAKIMAALEKLRAKAKK